MVDKTKPLKIEDATDGTQMDFGPTEMNPTEDYAAVKGISLENEDGTLIDKNADGNIQFTDSVNGTKKVSDLLDAEQEDFDPTGSSLSSTKTGPAIRELDANTTASASPGFSFGRAGTSNAGTWLLRPGGATSNSAGVNFGLANGSLDVIATGSKNTNTYTLTIYQHDGDELNLTTIATVGVTASRKEIFEKDTDFTQLAALTKNRHIAIQITAGSARDIGVDLQLSGTKA